jgi:WD40 repeat protein
MLLTGSYEPGISIWNTTQGSDHLPLSFANQDEVCHITTIKFSDSGDQVAYGTSNGKIMICNLQLGSEVLQINGDFLGITSLSFSRDGSKIVSGSNTGEIHVWNTASGEKILWSTLKHCRRIHSIIISPDGTFVFSGSEDGTVCLWDLDTGHMDFQTKLAHCHEAHDSYITDNSLAFSPDGSKILACCTNQRIHLWETTSGALFTTLRPKHIISSVAFSLDGSYVLSQSAQWRYEWSCDTGQLVSQATCPVHNCVAIQDPIILTPTGWIAEVRSKRILEKLPSNIVVENLAATETSIAFNTSDSDLRIMHFPPCTLTSSGTWDPGMVEGDEKFDFNDEIDDYLCECNDSVLWGEDLAPWIELVNMWSDQK